MQREIHVEFEKIGKRYIVSAYEKRRNADGEVYYALADRFDGKQKARLLQWAGNVGKSVYSAIAEIVK